jgi:hypothetical protein
MTIKPETCDGSDIKKVLSIQKEQRICNKHKKTTANISRV